MQCDSPVALLYWGSWDLMSLRTGAELELQSRRLGEHSWKAGPQGVIAP
jgi:hypothetical protein